jgi:hypothetical protein
VKDAAVITRIQLGRFVAEIINGEWVVYETGPKTTHKTMKAALKFIQKMIDTWPDEAPTQPKLKRVKPPSLPPGGSLR